jgi:hypothetical protein
MKHNLSFGDLENVCYKEVILSLTGRTRKMKRKKRRRKERVP